MHGNPMQVAITNTTAETALTAPRTVRCDCHLSASILFGVVNIKFEWLGFMRLNQCKQVFRLMQYSISTNDIVRV
jgi:hypothetical protein